MAPKKNSTSTVNTPAPSTPSAPATTAASALSKASASSSNNPFTIFSKVYQNYTSTTAQRTKLIDAFLGFLVITGVLQFIYCVIAGNYPFNAFLAGFSATVGQFVLTASLRIQSNPVNKNEFSSVSPERAFADFVFGSVLLHLFCTNFIN
ncbi:defender against death DAD protein [Morchella conica CCBAS932]|uniref:Dolichyl-diphosphooligosaccharide--protein glycosyltransferase subunit OST2 n=1 Tax=Morchella conica CCBAS932 TaxID=1392247 RepID=A0A3N4KL53_9PEZI|nr:defender against death DAD protein [Morchella conica CCBAS932]